jgi:hypothetical protein
MPNTPSALGSVGSTLSPLVQENQMWSGSEVGVKGSGLSSLVLLLVLLLGLLLLLLWAESGSVSLLLWPG